MECFFKSFQRDLKCSLTVQFEVGSVQISGRSVQQAPDDGLDAWVSVKRGLMDRNQKELMCLPARKKTTYIYKWQNKPDFRKTIYYLNEYFTKNACQIF
jgi:hypothetical protein